MTLIHVLQNQCAAYRSRIREVEESLAAKDRRIEELEKRLESQPSPYHCDASCPNYADQTNTDLRARNTLLEEVVKFADHNANCACLGWEEKARDCTCGLNQSLAKLEEKHEGRYTVTACDEKTMTVEIARKDCPYEHHADDCDCQGMGGPR